MNGTPAELQNLEDFSVVSRRFSQNCLWILTKFSTKNCGPFW